MLLIKTGLSWIAACLLFKGTVHPFIPMAGIETAIIQVPYVLSCPYLVCGLRRPIGTDLKEQFTLLLLFLKEQFTHLLQCL